jgi:hypothetical protein
LLKYYNSINFQGKEQEVKKILFTTFLMGGLVLFTFSFGFGQFLGQLGTAKVVPQGESYLGGYFGAYEDAFSFFGAFRHGIGPDFDLGFKLGFMNFDFGRDNNKSGVAFGGDFKYQFLNAKYKDPFDMSFGVNLEYMKVSDYSLLGIGGNLIASYDFKVQGANRYISPYGRFNFRWERESWDLPAWAEGDDSHTDFEIGFNVGADFQINSNLHLAGEFQFDKSFGFIAGISYHIF